MRAVQRWSLALAIGSAWLACGAGGSDAPPPPPSGRPNMGMDTAGRGAPADAGSATDSGVLENPLLGSWRQEVGACAYTHAFDDSGGYRMRATTGEAVDASYELEPPTEAVARWSLTFTIVSDNNVVDCEGHQNDETGASHAAYLEFVGDNRVDVYRGSTDSASFFSWTRL